MHVNTGVHIPLSAARKWLASVRVLWSEGA